MILKKYIKMFLIKGISFIRIKGNEKDFFAGNRTVQQVTSRVQKYFLKLRRAGLPIPGRIPKTLDKRVISFFFFLRCNKLEQEFVFIENS